jgi:hypothetical protein
VETFEERSIKPIELDKGLEIVHDCLYFGDLSGYEIALSRRDQKSGRLADAEFLGLCPKLFLLEPAGGRSGNDLFLGPSDFDVGRADIHLDELSEVVDGLHGLIATEHRSLVTGLGVSIEKGICEDKLTRHVVAVAVKIAYGAAKRVGVAGLSEGDEQIHHREKAILGFDDLQVPPLDSQTGLIQIGAPKQGDLYMRLDFIQYRIRHNGSIPKNNLPVPEVSARGIEQS